MLLLRQQTRALVRLSALAALPAGPTALPVAPAALPGAAASLASSPAWLLAAARAKWGVPGFRNKESGDSGGGGGITGWLTDKLVKGASGKELEDLDLESAAGLGAGCMRCTSGAPMCCAAVRCAVCAGHACACAAVATASLIRARPSFAVLAAPAFHTSLKRARQLGGLTGFVHGTGEPETEGGRLPGRQACLPARLPA